MMAVKRPEHESDAARAAFADYVEMGAGRTLEGLVKQYRTRTGPVPTRQLTQVKLWSSTWGWQRRLTAMENRFLIERENEYDRRRAEVMDQGYALDFERVRLLVAMMSRLGNAFVALGESWSRPLNDAEFDRAIKLVPAVEHLAKGIAQEKGERQKTVNIRADTLAWTRDYARSHGLDEAEAVRIAEAVLRGEA